MRGKQTNEFLLFLKGHRVLITLCREQLPVTLENYTSTSQLCSCLLCFTVFLHWHDKKKCAHLLNLLQFLISHTGIVISSKIVLHLLIIKVQFSKWSLQTLSTFKNFSAVVSGKEFYSVILIFLIKCHLFKGLWQIQCPQELVVPLGFWLTKQSQNY